MCWKGFVIEILRRIKQKFEQFVQGEIYVLNLQI